MEQDIKLPKKIENFLAKKGIKYEMAVHRTVYTAFDKAATMRVKPAAIAKVLVVKIDRDLAMVVIGGDKNLNIEKLQKLAKAKTVGFAKEKIIGETFKGIDPGAITPFSEIWGIKLFCDKKILEQPKMILSAGTYEASIKLAPGAFIKANPEMVIAVISKAREKTKAAPKVKKPAKKTNKTQKRR